MSATTPSPARMSSPDPVGLRYGGRVGHGRACSDSRTDARGADQRSVTDDHIVCLEDGKKRKTLKRHLMTDHGLTPEAYRTSGA